MSAAGIAAAVERTGPDSAVHMAGIHARCFTPFWSDREIAAMLHMPTTIGLLWRKADRPAGMALFRATVDEAEVLTIGVVPDLRGRGIAGALLRRGEGEAAALGARRMILEVSIHNQAAKSLYDRAGYREIGRRRDYYTDGSDALVLEKALPGDGQGPG